MSAKKKQLPPVTSLSLDTEGLSGQTLSSVAKKHKTVGVVFLLGAISALYTLILSPLAPRDKSGSDFCVGPEHSGYQVQCWTTGDRGLYYMEDVDGSPQITGSLIEFTAPFFDAYPTINDREKAYASVTACDKARLDTAKGLGIPQDMARENQEFLVCNPGQNQRLFYYINKAFAGENRDYPMHGTRGSFVFDGRGSAYLMAEYEGRYSLREIERVARKDDVHGSDMPVRFPQDLAQYINTPLTPLRELNNKER